MNPLPLLSSLLLATTVLALAQSEPILTVALDDQAVTRVPISRARVTAFVFPGPIQAISAVNVTSSATNLAGFQLDFRPPSFFFSVRGLLPRATANLNVLWNQRSYVFELFESDTPVLSVQLVAPPPVVRQPPRPVTPNRLVGLLQKAKGYLLLKKHQPAALVGASRVTPNRILDYGDYEIELTEVMRFDPEDSLVFHVLVRNKTNAAIRYETFSLRVGERVYSPSLTDAKGVLSPNEEQHAYFVVTGTPTGGRNLLSLKNDFLVSLQRLP